MPTWKEFIAQANLDLDKEKKLLTTSGTILLQEALNAMTKSMAK